jgi:hypothetical protein
MAEPDSPADTPAPGDTGAPRHGTITEQTPSIPQYFTWINNTNEGATEEQTLINLRFFKWLHDEFGMRLGIYAFDAGAIDSQEFYGRMDSERFRKQFPKGFKEIAELARSFDCRLGLWGGPDGFGDTPEEEAAPPKCWSAFAGTTGSSCSSSTACAVNSATTSSRPS